MAVKTGVPSGKTTKAGRNIHGHSDGGDGAFHMSYTSSQEVVWKVRNSSKLMTGNAELEHYSMSARRDKALNIFHRDNSEEKSSEEKEKSDLPYPKQTRVGYVDDERVDFELVSDVTQKPEVPYSEREGTKVHCINYKPMSNEEKFRLYMSKWTIMTLCWLYTAVFILSNVIFAALLSIEEKMCCGDSTMSFADNFAFSIQTWTTIGYGTFSPVGHFSSFLVAIMSILSLVLNTIFAGLLFVRIIKPTANLQFSKIVTYCNIHGLPCLEIRVGNPDNFNALIDIEATLNLVWEGKEICEYENGTIGNNSVVVTTELKLLQDSYFTMTGVRTFRHVIDESSPLFGLRIDEFEGIFYLQFRIISTNKTTLTQISDHTVYDRNDVLVGHRFQQQINFDKDTGILHIDFSKMNETIPYCVWYPKKTKKEL